MPVPPRRLKDLIEGTVDHHASLTWPVLQEVTIRWRGSLGYLTAWAGDPAAYLQFSEAYQDQAARARELGWPVAERMSHHLAPLTHPSQVAESLRELLDQLGP